VNYAVLLFPDFSMILCGWLLCRYTALNRQVWEPVESLVYYFLFPVLLFHSIVKSPIQLDADASLVLSGLLMTVAGVVLAQALPVLLRLWPSLRADPELPRDHAASAQAAFRFNSFIALGLAERLSAQAQDGRAPLLMALLIGVCVPLVNVAAVWPMARHAGRGLLRELVRNPLIIATVSGLACNLAGLRMPDWIVPSLSRIGAASLALGLMAAGAGMQFGTLARSKALTASVLTIRHLLLPLVALGLSLLLQLDRVQATTLLIFSALPTASSTYVLAARMGYNGALVASMVTLSTALGVLSLPYALSLQRHF
jgi:malonate transporter